MIKKALIIGAIFIFIGCENSNFHTSYSSNPNYNKEADSKKITLNKIAIGSISSSDFWRTWERDYAKDRLEYYFKKLGNVKVVNSYSTPYRINLDIHDYSSKPKEKMGSFLGQKQYRIVQDYNINGWYRIEKRGANHTIKQGTVSYSSYADIGSGTSFEDAKKRVIKKKIDGVTKKVVSKVLDYFKK